MSTKRTFRAYRNGVEVGKTTTQRDDRAYVAAVVLTYPLVDARDGQSLGKWAGKVKVSNWSSDMARAVAEAVSKQASLGPRGWKVEVVTDIRPR